MKLNLTVLLALFAAVIAPGVRAATIEILADSKVEYYPGYPTGGIMWYIGCRVKFGY